MQFIIPKKFVTLFAFTPAPIDKTIYMMIKLSRGIPREAVFSSFTMFMYSRVAMFRAPLHCGSLEAGASSCSKPFTALMQ